MSTKRQRRMYRVRYRLKKLGNELVPRMRAITLRADFGNSEQERAWINELISRYDHCVQSAMFPPTEINN